MNSLLVLTVMVANINTQLLNSDYSTFNGTTSRNLVAQSTCGMSSLEMMEDEFPRGTIVNDGYSNFKVVDYSPSFAAVLVKPVDTQGNELGQTNYWRCVHILKTGTM